VNKQYVASLEILSAIAFISNQSIEVVNQRKITFIHFYHFYNNKDNTFETTASLLPVD